MTRAKTLWRGKGNNSSEFPRRKHTPETENNQLFSPSWPPVQYVPFSSSPWRKPTRQERHQTKIDKKKSKFPGKKMEVSRQKERRNKYISMFMNGNGDQWLTVNWKMFWRFYLGRRREKRERGGERGAEANLVRHICLGHVIMVKLNTSLIDQISTRFFSSWARKRTFATLCRRSRRVRERVVASFLSVYDRCEMLRIASLYKLETSPAEGKKKEYSACICKEKMCILTKRITDLIQTKDNICKRRKRLVLWYGVRECEQIM